VSAAARRAILERVPTSEEQIAVMRDHVRNGATDRPGVYRLLASGGEVLYIGKSKQLRTRLLSYFRCAYPEDKGARMLRESSAIDWEYVPSEFAALLSELRLIKRFRPRFNVALKRDAHNYAFIKVTRGPAPKLAVVRSPGTDDGGTYYGPFLGAQRLGEALRELSDALGLRDCAHDTPVFFSDQPDLFAIPPRTPGCIRLEIRKCLGPCVGACGEAEYAGRVSLARAFLDGADDGPIASLLRQMQEASARLDFERAAALRDKVQRLEVLREQFARLRFAVETLSFVYPVPGVDGDDRVYLIRRGCVRAERTAPRTADESEVLQQLVAETFSGGEPAGTSVAAHDVDELMLVSSWFRQHPAELDRAVHAKPTKKPARKDKTRK
jgi:excinuclease ABC subunit C